MSAGDEGPYVEIDGPRVWVPRSVPWRRAWSVAREAIQDYGLVLQYDGKQMGTLYGFTRDCFCEGQCELAYVDDEPTGDTTCEVPVWAFTIVEPR